MIADACINSNTSRCFEDADRPVNDGIFCPSSMHMKNGNKIAPFIDLKYPPAPQRRKRIFKRKTSGGSTAPGTKMMEVKKAARKIAVCPYVRAHQSNVSF